jgi:hypothetical protein
MSRDPFSISESEFLTVAATFNAETLTHAVLLGIPDAPS